MATESFPLIDLCSCFNPGDLEPSIRVFRATGAQRGGVLTERVRNGFYWWIPLLSAITSDATAQVFDLYLVEPAFYPIAIPLGTTAATPAGCYKILPANGQSGSGDTAFFSNAGRAAAMLNQMPVIIVPSGWALLLAEANAGIPAGARDLTLRFLKAEVKNGCPPPF